MTPAIALLVFIAMGVWAVVLVLLGAYIQHRAQAGRPPIPDVGALMETVTIHRRPDAPPPADDLLDELRKLDEAVPPFRA